MGDDRPRPSPRACARWKIKSTPAPSVGNGDGGNGDGVNGAGPGPVGGAQVLGLAATAGPVSGIEYLFYERYDQDVTLTQGQILTINPTVNYVQGINFPWHWH